MTLSELPAILWAAFLVVLFFGGSIFVHELGHFLAARRRGLKVERFSIGFGPKICSWRGKDGVEYRLSWLPLGGYVSLPQLADMRAIEGEASPEAAKLPAPSYSTKVIVFSAGAAFNIIFAFLLAFFVWKIGEPSSSTLTTTTVAEVSETLETSTGKVASPASLAGLRPGDVIIKVDGRPVTWFGEIVERLALGDGWTSDGRRKTIFTVRRGEETLDLEIHPVLSGSEKLRMVGFSPVSKIIVAAPSPGSPAAAAGLQKEDQIIAINQVPILTIYQLVQTLNKQPPGPYTLSVLRDGKEQALTIKRAETHKNASATGIELQAGIVFSYPTPWEQIRRNVSKTVETLIKLLSPRSDIGLSHLSSPIGIISNFFDLAKQGMPFVLWFTILVNVNLAIFNLLPIPVLDGGHIAFATIAKLRGRALPANFIANTQGVFMMLLFAMIIYVGFFDIKRIARNNADSKPAATATSEPSTAVPAK
ncbi:MAG: RIP metalloprotease RseP [Opitutaceae bacterium]|nr:RIP metalloprotease RseP [Opitutaceae bacterium]